MKLLALFFMIFFLNSTIASEVDDYVKEGIKFHDEGLYDKAVQQYKKALALEPENYQALYELTFAYMSSHQNQKCIKAAKLGLKAEAPRFKRQFFVSLGSCYSQLGKNKEAIETFKSGLEIAPKDYFLHLNIAVTLLKVKKEKKAVAHFKEAIKNSDGQASAYYYLAEKFREKNYRIPALSFYMQFMLLEPNTKRSADAATKIHQLVYQGSKREEDGSINISIDPDAPKDEGDFSAVELALSVAAASKTKDGKNSSIDVEHFTDTLTTFLQASSELDNKKFKSTFTSEYALKNMISLQRSSDFNTYAYYIADKAGLIGAREWLRSNEAKIKKLSRSIQKL